MKPRSRVEHVRDMLRLRLRLGEGICSMRSASAATDPAGCPTFVTGGEAACCCCCRCCCCCWKAEAIGGACGLTAVDSDICAAARAYSTVTQQLACPAQVAA